MILQIEIQQSINLLSIIIKGQLFQVKMMFSYFLRHLKSFKAYMAFHCLKSQNSNFTMFPFLSHCFQFHHQMTVEIYIIDPLIKFPIFLNRH